MFYKIKIKKKIANKSSSEFLPYRTQREKMITHKKIRLPKESIQRVLSFLSAARRIQKAWRSHRRTMNALFVSMGEGFSRLAALKETEEEDSDVYEALLSMAKMASGRIEEKIFRKILHMVSPKDVLEDVDLGKGKRLYCAYLIALYPKHVFYVHFERTERRLEAAAKEFCKHLGHAFQVARQSPASISAEGLVRSARSFVDCLEAWESNLGEDNNDNDEEKEKEEVQPKTLELISSLVLLHKGPAKVLRMLEKGELRLEEEREEEGGLLERILERVLAVAKTHTRMDEDTERALECVGKGLLCSAAGVEKRRMFRSIMRMMEVTCPRLEYYVETWQRMVKGDEMGEEKVLGFMDEYSKGLWLHQYVKHRLTPMLEGHIRAKYWERAATTSLDGIRQWVVDETERVRKIGPFFPRHVPVVYIIVGNSFVRQATIEGGDEVGGLPETARVLYDHHKEYFAAFTKKVLHKVGVLLVSFQGKQEGVLSFKEFTKVFNDEVSPQKRAGLLLPNVDERLKGRMGQLLLFADGGGSSSMRRILQIRWRHHLLHRVMMRRFGEMEDARYPLLDQIFFKLGHLIDEGVDLLVKLVDLHVAVYGATYARIMCPWPKLL